MKALFEGFKKPFLAFKELRISGFSLRGCLTPLTECFHFFPCLLRVDLTRSNLDERDLRGLVCSLEPIPNLRSLWLVGNPMGDKNRVESIAKQALPHVGLHY